jgi:hypothetical protein
MMRNVNDIALHSTSAVPQEAFDGISALNASPISVRYDISKIKMNMSLRDNGDLHAARIVE